MTCANFFFLEKNISYVFSFLFLFLMTSCVAKPDLKCLEVAGALPAKPAAHGLEPKTASDYH